MSGSKYILDSIQFISDSDSLGRGPTTNKSGVSSFSLSHLLGSIRSRRKKLTCLHEVIQTDTYV